MGGSRGAISKGLLVALMIGIVGFLAIAAGDAVEGDRLRQMTERGRFEAERRVSQLAAELHRYDYLADVLASHPDAIEVLLAPANAAAVDRANRYLETINRAAASAALYLIGPDGKCLAASNWRDPVSFVGIDVSFRPYYRDALQNGSARFYGIGTTSDAPGYYFSKAIKRDDGLLGLVVVKVFLDPLQPTASASGDGAVVADENGVIVLSSRSEWRYHTIEDLSPEILAGLRKDRQYDNEPLTPLGLRVERDLGANAHLISLPVPDGAARADYVAQQEKLDSSNWTVIGLSNAADLPFFRLLANGLVVAASLAIGLFALYLAQMRLTVRLESKGRALLQGANERLEAQVSERTGELVATNDRLRMAQDELIHSARLAAIGQVAAGVTHELNQPLAAIRTLSDNTEVLIKREKFVTAAANLKMISDLVGRMSRITSQLKLFARKDRKIEEQADVVAAIQASLRILEDKSAKIDAQISFSSSGEPLLVNAESSSLEQILINVLGNALDATAEVAAPRVDVHAERQGQSIIVTVQDNGPGIPEAAVSRLFEPFFTTKSAGAGLGLGLSISEGIIRSFGGAIHGENGPGGGATFFVELPASQVQEEAGHG